MYTTKSGDKYGSSYVGKKKDLMHGHEPDAEPKQKAMAALGEPHGAPQSTQNSLGEPQEGQEPQEDSMETPEQSVQENGPAAHVHVHSDHKSGKHVVIAHHTNGKMHHSTHPDAASAMQAAKTLGGGAEPETDESSMGQMGGGGEESQGMPRFA